MSRAQRLLPILAAGLCAAGLTGCGGAEPAPAVPSVPRPVAALGPALVAPVDTSQPRDLAWTMRIRHPEDTLDALSFVTGTPLSLLLSVATQVEEAKILATIDLRAPMDGAALAPPASPGRRGDDDDQDDEPTEDPPPLAAFTFGVTNGRAFLDALPAGTAARARRDGLVRVEAGELVCHVRPDPGASRVVCGSTDEALRALGPWMTQTLAAEPLPPADVRSTLLAAPARERLRALAGTELRADAAEARESLSALGVSDPELLALPEALLDEAIALVDDAERLDVDLDLDAKARTATARFSASFRGTSSWVTRVLADPAERRGPPPAMFWRAPKDADSASWGLSASPRHYATMRRVLSKTVQLAGSRGGFAPDETAAVVGVVDSLPAYGGPWMTAHGSLPWKAPPKGKVTPQNALADLEARSRALLGWGLACVEGPAAPWIAWVASIENAWKKGLSGAKRAFPGDASLGDAPEARLVRAPAGYPRGSVALDFTVKVDSHLAWSSSPRLRPGDDGLTPPHPPGPPARGKLSLRVVVVPDGDRTFLAWSMDDAALRAHVRAALQGAPESGTIGARPDLARLRRVGTGGGFFSLRSWVDLALELAAADPDVGASGQSGELALVGEAISKMPNRGQTAVLTLADGSAGAAPTLSFELVVQEGTVEDVRALGQFAMGKGLRELILGSGAEGVLSAPVAPPPPPRP